MAHVPPLKIQSGSSDPEIGRQRRGWPILAGVLLMVGFAALLAWYWKPAGKQTGTVFAILRAGAFSAPDVTAPSKQSEGRRNEVYRQTQVTLLRTRSVLERALQTVAALDLSLVREQPEPLAWLEKELRVEAHGTTKTISVTLAGDRPAERAQLVNAVVHAYLAEFVEGENREQHDRLARCEAVAKQQSDELGRQMEKLQQTLRRLDGRPARIQWQLSLERATPIEKELEAKSSELEKAQLQLEVERKKARGPDAEKVPDGMIDEYLARDPAAMQLAAQILKLRRTLAGYEESARGGDAAADVVKSSVKGYRADLAVARQQLDQRREDVRKRLAQAAQRGSQHHLKQLEEQVSLLKDEEQLLRRQLERQLHEEKAPSSGPPAEIEALAKDVERKLDSIKRFNQECERVRKELQTRLQVVLVLEAHWPEP